MWNYFYQENKKKCQRHQKHSARTLLATCQISNNKNVSLMFLAKKTKPAPPIILVEKTTLFLWSKFMKYMANKFDKSRLFFKHIFCRKYLRQGFTSLHQTTDTSRRDWRGCKKVAKPVLFYVLLSGRSHFVETTRGSTDQQDCRRLQILTNVWSDSQQSSQYYCGIWTPKFPLCDLPCLI